VVPAELAVTPHRLTLGKVVFGNGAVSRRQHMTIANLSKNRAVTFSSMGATGDFAITTDCGATLEPKSTCRVTIQFSPTGFGRRDGTLTIGSNASNAPNSINLTGKGTRGKK